MLYLMNYRNILVVVSARISVIALCLVFSFRLINFLCFVAIFARYVHLHSLYRFGSRAL